MRIDNYYIKRHAAFFLIISIALAASMPYLSSIHNPFIWDEEVIIAGNPIIKELRHLPYLFNTNIFGSGLKPGSYYRPVYMLSFMLDYHIWKLNPEGYHVSNIFFHALSALAFYALMLRIGLNKKAAWVASLLFALFPVNCESVTLIAARVEPMVSLFCLLCFLTYLKSVTGSRNWFFASVCLFILAIMTKENALVMPFIILAYVLIFLKGQKRKKAIFSLSGLVVLGLIYSTLRLLFIGNPQSATLSLINEASFVQRLYTFPVILLTYIRLIVFPLSLRSEYLFVARNINDPYVWLSALLVILLSVVLVKSLRPRKLALFFLSWFFLGTLPYCNIIIPLHATAMEHWAYLPSMGFAAMLSLTFFNLRERFDFIWVRRVMIVILMLLMLFYAVRITMRNREWRDPFTLYKNDSGREPDSFLLHCNLGVEYFRKGMMSEAKREFMASNNVSPGRMGYDVAYNNLGVIYAREGAIQEATRCYKTSIALNNYALAYANLGGLYNNLQMHKDAISLLEEGTGMYPLDVEIKYQLGIAYYRSGNIEYARKTFEAVEKIQPDYSQARSFLSNM
ncbi:MAG: tetratricopeptide repeat protein [Candidatus Omnitrophota bacterium]